MPRKYDPIARRKARLERERKLAEQQEKARVERLVNENANDLADDLHTSHVKRKVREARQAGSTTAEIAASVVRKSPRSTTRVLERTKTAKKGRPAPWDRKDIRSFIKKHYIHTYPTAKALKFAIEGAFDGVKLNYVSFARWLRASK